MTKQYDGNCIVAYEAIHVLHMYCFILYTLPCDFMIVLLAFVLYCVVEFVCIICLTLKIKREKK